ncbi:zwei Ig domain protein zig-8-like [Penaeus monodon]|uniref:zwei Ig domain protein zig-8-like n=1 Tax=Penaeus monodon TaxID=6687 RepID=UPI0018A6DC7D|nr:zwei Ig domain protein zig-8-like [Penaeus monodon]
MRATRQLASSPSHCWLAVLITLLFLSGFQDTSCVLANATENPQRMWDPEKGSILGQGVGSFALENVTTTNQTVEVGSTVFLHCQVRNLADKQVSWIRRRDYHILTSGLHTYSKDERFTVVRPEDADDWALQIRFVQKRDEGAYECQVSTKTGRYGYVVNLKVVTPKAVISGSSELHVQSGSTISLLCIIEGSLSPPQFIFWYHDNRMINYDQSRGDISVTIDHQELITSRLTINNASFKDSGNYTCSANNINPSSVNVYVSEGKGDKTAAIQRLGSGSESVTSSATTVCSLLLVVLLNSASNLCSSPGT